MKKSHTTAILSGIILCSASAHAAISVSMHNFSAVTNGAISSAGTSDWGYVSVSGGFFDSNLGGAGLSYNNTAFGSVARNNGTVLTTVSGSSTIGAVTLTESISGTNVVDPQGNSTNYTFDGASVFGSYGNFAPTEQDVWRLTFNDLGVGTHQITLYLGHTQSNREFDIDVSYDGGASTEFTTSSGGPISALGSTVTTSGGPAFTYNIEVITTAATDDLTLTLGGTGGGFGGAFLSAYTVTTVPEPSTFALFGGLVSIAILLRRRR